ncbi:hypothetical protein HK098_002016 [Nowakowskiella sp. JEL0407]|nr:hypothetical protein HK098_002016 [Nowakowskiella sp. JEL0407]
MDTSNPKFTEIPEELIRQICSHLTPETLCKLRQSCRKLSETARYYFCRNPPVEKLLPIPSPPISCASTHRLHNHFQIPAMMMRNQNVLTAKPVMSRSKGIWIGEEYVWRALKFGHDHHAFEIALRCKTATSITPTNFGGVSVLRRETLLTCVLRKVIRCGLEDLKNMTDKKIQVEALSPVESSGSTFTSQLKCACCGIINCDSENGHWSDSTQSSGTEEDSAKTSKTIQNSRHKSLQKQTTASRRRHIATLTPINPKVPKPNLTFSVDASNHQPLFLPNLEYILDATIRYPKSLYALSIQFVLLFPTSQLFSPQDALTYHYKNTATTMSTKLDLIRFIWNITTTIDARTPENDAMILRIAARLGNLEVLRWLIEKAHLDICCDRNAVICEAAAFGFLEIVKYLVERGADIHARWETCARKSAANGHFELLKWLGKMGANVRELDDYALAAASANGQYEIVQWLVEDCGANIHARDDAPVRNAAANGNLEIVAYLFKKGANLRALNDEAIRKATLSGNFDLTLWLMLNGCNFRANDDEAFINACKSGNTKLAMYLINSGADIFADRGVALRSAATGGHLELVKILYSQGLTQKTHLDGAVKDASRNGHLLVVKWLYEHAKVDIRADNDAPIRCAAVTGNLELVEWLYTVGADIRANSDHAIRRAAKLGHLKLLRWLYQYGGDIRIKDDKSFRNAAKHGHIDVVQWLYYHGADLRAVDDLAVTLASKGGHLPVVQWLCLNGADPAAGGNRALCGAVAFGQLEVVKWLHSQGAHIAGNVNAMALRMAEGHGRKEVLEWLRKQPEYSLIESGNVLTIGTMNL